MSITILLDSYKRVHFPKDKDIPKTFFNLILISLTKVIPSKKEMIELFEKINIECLSYEKVTTQPRRSLLLGKCIEIISKKNPFI